jgi:hypothetical protein
MKHNSTAPAWMPASQQQPAPATMWPAPGIEQQTVVPARPASVIADVLVPLLQATITGALLAGVFVLLTGEMVPRLDVDPLKLALGIAGVSWVVLLLDHRKLLWAIERLTHLDLDGDGTEGEPAPQRHVLSVTVQQGSRTRLIDTDDLGCTEQQMVTFSRAIVGGQSLAEAAWGDVFGSRPRYVVFRARLVDAGLLAPVNPAAPAQGFRATQAGAAVFRRVVEYADGSE